MIEAFEAYKARPDQDRLLELLTRSQDAVYNLCYQVLRHVQDAEDTSQVVFLELLDHLEEIPDGIRFSGWLRQVAFHHAINGYRTRRRRRAHETRAAQMLPPAASDPTENGATIHAHLSRLAEQDRSLLLHYYYEGRNLESLASEQRCSTTAAWKRLGRAKENLRKSLQGAGVAGAVAAMDSFLNALEPVTAPAGLLKTAVTGKASSLAKGGPAGALVGAAGWTAKSIVALWSGILLGGASLLTAAALGRQPERPTDNHAKLSGRSSAKGSPSPAHPEVARMPAAAALAEANAVDAPVPPTLKTVKDFRDALQKALLMMEDGDRWNALRALGIPLSDAEFSALLQKARGTKGRSRFGWSLFDAILETWTVKDPQGALRTLLSFENPKLNGVGVQEAMNFRTEAVWKASRTWSLRDPLAAKAYLQDYLDNIEQAVRNGAWPPAFNYGFDQRLDELDARSDLREFARKLLAHSDPAREPERYWTLARVWGATAPEEAVRWGSQLPEEHRWQFFEALAATWGETDPQAAIRWARGLLPKAGDNPVLRNAYEAAAKTHPEVAVTAARLDPDVPDQFYVTIAQIWAQDDPRAAAELLLTRPRTSEGEIPGLRQLIQEWAKSDDPAVALEWVRKHAGASDRSKLVSALAAGWVSSNGSATADALALARSVPEEEKFEVLREFGSAWSAIDPVQAAAWIQSTPGLLSRSLSSDIAYQLDFHGKDAFEWARSLPAGENRDWALVGVLCSPHHSVDIPRTLALTREIEDPGLQNVANMHTALIWPRKDFKGLVEWIETLPEAPPRPGSDKRPLEGGLSWVDQNYDAFGTREKLFATAVINAGHSRSEQEETIRNSRLSAAEKESLLRQVENHYRPSREQ